MKRFLFALVLFTFLIAPTSLGQQTVPGSWQWIWQTVPDATTAAKMLDGWTPTPSAPIPPTIIDLNDTVAGGRFLVVQWALVDLWAAPSNLTVTITSSRATAHNWHNYYCGFTYRKCGMSAAAPGPTGSVFVVWMTR